MNAINKKMTNKELIEFIEKNNLPKLKGRPNKEQLTNHINTHWKEPEEDSDDEDENPYANGAFDADYCKCWKCFEKGVVVFTHPELNTAEFQNVVDDEILTEFLPVCEKCYDDWEDVCEKCDSRVCTLRYWEDCRGDPYNYCEDCYAEDEDRIEQKCENGNCDRQCIEDEDYCYSCKEDLEEEEDDSDDEEGDGMMECPECKGRFPSTIISKWGSICAPCFHIHRKTEEECKAMGAEDFDAPVPVPVPDIKWENGNGGFINIFFPEYDVPYPDFALYELIIDGKVIETEKYPRVISEGGDMEYTGL